MTAALAGVWLVDPPAAWGALGFAVTDGVVAFDGVCLRLGAGAPALEISELEVADLDGVPLVRADVGPDAAVHPNGVIGIDHFVLITPDFDRTAAACEAAGMPFRRVRDAGGFRQGFRRLGPAILEVVEALEMPPGPTRFWGLTFVASDLDALAALLGDRLRPPKEAVQPGRRIATLDRSAGLSAHVAFMTAAHEVTPLSDRRGAGREPPR
ncbi:MAG TPA: hypothetical protein VG410_03350 [Solirubrobacteraceae bacterium]|nr:hypothetical protein [Solirubrobacteraceae bacterium]